MFFADRHFLTLPWVDTNRLFDQIAIAIGNRRQYRQVLFFDTPCCELAGEMVVDLVGFCDDQDTAGVSIEAMDNSGATGATHFTQLVKVEQQR